MAGFDIYVRVSRVGGRDGANFISPEVQEEAARRFAEAKSLELTGAVFTDLDVSGGTMDREQLNEALARICSGVSEGIVVAKLDRFARSMQGALNVLAEISDAGGQVVAADGDFDTTTAMGRFARDLMLRMAELYREQIADGWAVAHEKGIAGGRYQGAAPAGYSKVDGILTPDADWASVVQEAFRMKTEGRNYGEVARYLTEQALPTRRGNTGWRATTVRKLIANRAYLGEARFGRHVNTAAHPALVDEDTFTLANRKERRAAPDRKDGRLLGSGLVRCGTCGAGLVYGRNKTGYEFLRCPSGSHICGRGASIARHLVEPYVISLAAEARAAWIADLRQETDPALKQRLELARTALENLEAAEGEEGMDPVTWARAHSKARASLVAAEAAWAEAAAPHSGREIGVEHVFTRVEEQDALGTVAERWEPRDVIAARGWLKAQLGGSVVVAPGRGSVQERVALAA